MKKILAVILVFGMVTTAAFAEINVTGYAQGTIAPFWMDSDASDIATGPDWGGLGPQIQLTVTGSSPVGNAGYVFSALASLPTEHVAAFRPGEENYAWIKPFGDFLTFKAGGFNDYSLRGGNYYSSLFDAAGLNNTGSWQFINEVTVFSGLEARVDGGNATRNPAAQITLDLLPGLYIGGSFHLNTPGFYQDDPDKSAADYYIDGQYTLGYTIEGIGVIKAQYIGQDTGRSITGYSDMSRLLQAGFKLTMLQNGPIEIGATIPVYYGKGNYSGGYPPAITDAPDGYEEPIVAALGTDLGFGKFGLKASFAAGFGGATVKDINKGNLFIGGLEPRYAITDTLTVAVPVGLTYQATGETSGTDNKDGHALLDVGASIRLDLGATWNINAGAVYGNQIMSDDNAPEVKNRFAIPIYFSGALF
jgi:hypothetical protein